MRIGVGSLQTVNQFKTKRGLYTTTNSRSLLFIRCTKFINWCMFEEKKESQTSTKKKDHF